MSTSGETPWRSAFGASVTPRGIHVRVWAPESVNVDVHAEVPPRIQSTPKAARLSRQPDGCFVGLVPSLLVGDRYSISMDGGPRLPDPASRCQPDGVHGTSEVIDPSAFQWRVNTWSLPSLDQLVIYELHVGTFTVEGTFAAAASRLPWLVTLGVTAVELMPVAACPGRRNWGYDVAAMYAPAPAYGRPDDLRRFVDEAHGHGLAVMLDVVYNHFSPDGAYAVAFSHRFLSDRHWSPWGAGVNLDGLDAALVRDFFIDNAQHWIHEYRIDGLRLDATHAIVDESPRHFLEELTSRVRASCPHRQVWVMAEDHRNLRTILDPPARRGWGLDAVWADDLHHVLRRLTAGDNEGYYRDFRGTPGEVARTLNDGWLYRGEHAPHFGGPRGTDPRGLPRAAFVVCLQNHDQVGNRALGDRLHHAVDAATYRALSVLLLLAPETPLLFMGQEWAASSPFQFFTDHAPDLGARVRDGRRDEFRRFRAFADAPGGEHIPNPQAEATFERSRLHWEETTNSPHSQVAELYRDALRLRREVASAGVVGGPILAQVAEGMTGIIVRRVDRAGHELFVIGCLAGVGHASLNVYGLKGARPGGRLNVATRGFGALRGRSRDDDSQSTRLNGWRVLIDTEDSRYSDDPRPASLACDTAKITVVFQRPGALVLMRH